MWAATSKEALARVGSEEIRVTSHGEHDILLMVTKKNASSGADGIDENIEHEEQRTSVL